jgi:hypothetical protein
MKSETRLKIEERNRVFQQVIHEDRNFNLDNNEIFVIIVIIFL